VDFLTVDDTVVVCFESHLVTRLGLTPSKFLIAVMSHLGCELVHFNPNAIVALSCFTMLCECWLGIALNTSLFWYFYSLLDMRRLSSSGSDCHFAAIAEGSTSLLPSRVAGKVLADGGS
jgi:hypothetical protein